KIGKPCQLLARSGGGGVHLVARVDYYSVSAATDCAVSNRVVRRRVDFLISRNSPAGQHVISSSSIARVGRARRHSDRAAFDDAAQAENRDVPGAAIDRISAALKRPPNAIAAFVVAPAANRGHLAAGFGGCPASGARCELC